MSQRHLSSLEPRRLFSIDLPAVIDPGQFETFDGVKIDASQFPAAPVTVQVTNAGPKVALPLLRDGVVTGTATEGADSVSVERRVGVDPASTLPGIVFFDGVESGSQGVQIYGSVKEAVAGFASIGASLDAALGSLTQTRAMLVSLGLDTTAFDAQIAGVSAQFDEVRASLNAALTTSFVRVTVAGQYDAYFLASEVTDVRVDALGGNDVVRSKLPTGQRLQLSGGAGNDTLWAAGRATLLGGTGNDRITANAASWIEGGAGNDMLIGSAESDVLIGGAGNDTFDLSRGSRTTPDSVDMGVGKDRTIGRFFTPFSKGRPIAFT